MSDYAFNQSFTRQWGPIHFGKRISTVEYGGMTALDSPNQQGFFPAILSTDTERFTLRIHKAEVINVW
jgi:hypothetical protein